MLTVQDPSSPTEDANSYKSLADFQARAVELGLAEPTEEKILIGMQYVDNKQFIGEPVIAYQGTAWPRQMVYEYVGGEQYEYSDTKIPQQVIDAVLYVAAEDDVYTSVTGGQRVQSKKIDVIEKSYFDDGINAAKFKQVTRADSLLSRFIQPNSIIMYSV